MDFDIAWFEPVFSPYLAWFGPSGVLSVSRALADRLGLGVPETMRAVDAALPCRAARADRLLTATLPVSSGGQVRFLCVAFDLEGNRVLAMRELPEPGRPVMELLDRDTFVRMFMNAGLGGIVVDRGLVVFASESFCRSMGIPHGAVIGMPLVDLVASQSLDDLAGACRKWCTTGDSEHEHVDLALVGGSGRLVHFRVTGGAFERGGRRLAWMVMHDLTERRRLERWLKDERKRYQELFDKLPVGALYISPRGRIVDCNATVSDIVGYPRERIRGSLFTEYVGAEQAEALRRDFRELFTRGERISRRETAIEASDGKVITIEYDARLIYKKGLRTMALMVFADITEKKTLELELLEKNAEMERTLWDMAEVKDALEARAGELNRATEELKLLNEKLNMLSITDGLTEVYNHRHFQDRLSEEVERLNRLKDGVLSLLMIDIDDFKKFNDTYGHQCGDAVLKHIAFLIKSSIRNIDIVARYGGEEFAVILPNAASDQARVVAERICRIVRSTPLALGGSVRPGVTVSIGVGTIRTGETDKSRLVHMADSALYAAKAKWKDRVEVWEEVA